MKNNPWFWIGLAAPAFAVGFPITKLLFDSGLSVWQINLARFVLATLVIVGVFGRRRRRREWKTGMLLGAVNVAAPSIFMSVGTDLLPSSVAGILTAFVPMATVLAAHWIVAGERFTVARLPGAFVAIAGVGILVAGGDGAGGRISIAGVAALLGGVAAAGVGGALSRRITMRAGAMPVVVPQYVGALLAIALVGVPLGGADLRGIGLDQAGLIVLLSLVSTALPFAAILKAFETTTAARAALVAYLVPLLAAALSIVILAEPVGVPFLVGGALIVVGVVVADRLERRIPIAATG